MVQFGFGKIGRGAAHIARRAGMHVTLAEVSEKANQTELGLAAYIISGDVGRALSLSSQIDAGVIGLNRGFISDPAAPFGGMKQSGIGREGGQEGILEFLEKKYIAVDW